MADGTMGIGWTYPTLYMSEVRTTPNLVRKADTESELQLSPIPVLGSQVLSGSRLTRFSPVLARKRRTMPNSTPHPVTRNDCAMVKGLLTCSWPYLFLDFRPVS
jgi:hypothetical protein